MRKAIFTTIGLLAILITVLSCSSDKKDSAKIDTPSDQMQAATPPAEMQAQTASPEQTGQMTTANTSEIIPDPSAVQFTALDVEGVTRQSNEWVTRGPVIINFWGTWCPPCRREIPDLVKLYDEYKSKGIEIVSLAVNDNPNSVKAFTAKAGMKWVMLMGTDEIYQKYGGIRGVPTTIFVDRTGKETDRFVGARTYETFKQAADKIL
jgi:thiol-disulfide isomerase/thioredoxin